MAFHVGILSGGACQRGGYHYGIVTGSRGHCGHRSDRAAEIHLSGGFPFCECGGQCHCSTAQGGRRPRRRKSCSGTGNFDHSGAYCRYHRSSAHFCRAGASARGNQRGHARACHGLFSHHCGLPVFQRAEYGHQCGSARRRQHKNCDAYQYCFKSCEYCVQLPAYRRKLRLPGTGGKRRCHRNSAGYCRSQRNGFALGNASRQLPLLILQ